MDTLIILVAFATFAVPSMVEVAAACLLVAGEPTPSRDAIHCS